MENFLETSKCKSLKYLESLLSQNGIWMPQHVQFASHSFIDVEDNYSVCEKKAMFFISELRIFRPYLFSFENIVPKTHQQALKKA